MIFFHDDNNYIYFNLNLFVVIFRTEYVVTELCDHEISFSVIFDRWICLLLFTQNLSQYNMLTWKLFSFTDDFLKLIPKWFSLEIELCKECVLWSVSVVGASSDVHLSDSEGRCWSVKYFQCCVVIHFIPPTDYTVKKALCVLTGFRPHKREHGLTTCV